MTYTELLRYGGGLMVVRQNLVPTTTLTAPAHVGDTALSVAASTGFRQRGILSWWDGVVSVDPPYGVTREPAATITTVAGATIDLDAPLTRDHAIGATVATNLVLSVPAATGDMVSQGSPVWAVVIPQWSSQEAGNRQWDNRERLVIICQTPIQQAALNPVLSQLWIEQQAEAADRDIGAIVDALKADPRFIVDGVSFAEYIDRFTVSLRQNVASRSIPVFEVYVTVDLVGLPDYITA